MIKTFQARRQAPCVDILCDQQTIVVGGEHQQISKFNIIKSSSCFLPSLCFDAIELKCSPIDKLIVFIQSTNELLIYNLRVGSPTRLLKYDKLLHSLDFSRDGRFIIVSTYNKSFVFSIQQKKCIWSVGYTISRAIFLADNSVLTHHKLNELKMWKLDESNTRQRLRTIIKINNSEKTYLPVEASPKDTNIIADMSGLWSLKIGKRCWENEISPYLYANIVAFSSNGATIAMAFNDNSIRLFHANNGSVLQTFHGHNERVISLKFFRDGHRLVSSSFDRTVAIWSVFNVEYFVKHVYFLLKKHVANYVTLEIVNFVVSHLKLVSFETECQDHHVEKTFCLQSVRQIRQHNFKKNERQ